MLTDNRLQSGSTFRERRCADAERGAANAAVVLVLLVLLASGGAAWFFLKGDANVSTGPDAAPDQAQSSSDLPSGKTAEKILDSAGTSAEKNTVEGSQGASRTDKPADLRPLTAAERRIMDWEDKLRDPGASTQDKLAALKALRKLDTTGEQYVPMMIDMLTEARDEELARGVILEMRKRKNHAFGQALLDSVMRREDKTTRIAAIRTLGAYLEEPAIKSVLGEVAERGDPEISHEVREALAGRKGHWNEEQDR